jgi:hypothetical protein
LNAKTSFFAKLANFQGEDRFASFVWLSGDITSMILSQNYAGRKQKSYKITKMQILVTWYKEKADKKISDLKLGASQA